MPAAPGQIFDIAGCHLHLHQEGQGRRSPAVVLESGIAGSLLGWSLVQPKIAEFAHVCSYDRAGLGWSGKCTAPRSVPCMISDLAALLERARIPPPFILVGHSFGGLLIRAYAHLRQEEVAGLVFVDPVSLEAWANCGEDNRRRLELGVRLSRRGALLARVGIVRFALWALASGARRFPKLIVNATGRSGAHTLERLTGEVRRLPPEVWPMIRAHWSRPKSFDAMAAYLECLPAAARLALSMPIPSEVPFAVLSAASATTDELRERERWVAESSNGEHIRVPDSAHWIQLEQPVTVVAAVRKIWERGRRSPNTKALGSTPCRGPSN